MIATTSSIFEFECRGDTLIATPTIDLRELEYEHVEAGATEVFEQLAQSHARHVVLDFRQTDYFGTTALGFFVALWKRVQAVGGRLAFCHLSAHEREILRITRLDTLWPLCASQEEALKVVQAARTRGSPSLS